VLIRGELAIGRISLRIPVIVIGHSGRM
jgi:hypothetical protein